MNCFTELIDTYLSNYSTYKNGKISFDCDYGELIFYKDKSTILTLFGVYLIQIIEREDFVGKYYII